MIIIFSIQDLKGMDHREHQTVDPMEATETGTGMGQAHKADPLVLEDLRVKCTVVEAPTLPAEALVDLHHLGLAELPVPNPPKKLRNTAAEAATGVTTAMVTAVVTAW